VYSTFLKVSNNVCGGEIIYCFFYFAPVSRCYDAPCMQDYDAFYQAVDEDRLYEFLGLERPGKSSNPQDQSQASVEDVPTSAETVNEDTQTMVAVTTVQFAAT